MNNDSNSFRFFVVVVYFKQLYKRSMKRHRERNEFRNPDEFSPFLIVEVGFWQF